MKWFAVLIKPLVHGARPVSGARGERGGVVGNGEKGRLPQGERKWVEHGGDILGVGEGVLGEKLSEVVDEELRVTIREVKRGAGGREEGGEKKHISKGEKMSGVPEGWC